MGQLFLQFYDQESKINMVDFNVLFCHNCSSNAHTPQIAFLKGSGWGKQSIL